MTATTDLHHIALLVFVIWLGGCGLLAVLTFLPQTRGQVKGLWPLMLSEAGILAAGTVLWFLPPALLGCALIAAALRLGFESGHVNGGKVYRHAGTMGALALSGVTALAWLTGPPLTWPSALVWIAAVAALLFVAGLSPERTWLRRFMLFPMLPFVLFVMAALWLDAGAFFLLSLLIVELFDSFAVLGGRLLGRHLMVPRLSPRKTWEGFAVGLAAALVAGISLSQVTAIPAATVILFAILSTIGAVVGDLTASAAKRHAGVKDYPPVLSIQADCSISMTRGSSPHRWQSSPPCCSAETDARLADCKRRIVCRRRHQPQHGFLALKHRNAAAEVERLPDQKRTYEAALQLCHVAVPPLLHQPFQLSVNIGAVDNGRFKARRFRSSLRDVNGIRIALDVCKGAHRSERHGINRDRGQRSSRFRPRSHQAGPSK